MPPDIRLVEGPSSPPPASAPGRDRGRIAAHRRAVDRAGLERLRAAVRRIEGGPMAGRDTPALALGVAAIDARLPWGGLAAGGLHDVVAADAGMASAFCALLCARLADAGSAAVLWCEAPRVLDAGMLYAPGLRRFGLDPARLIVASTGRDAETLWAMEEGLRCPALAAVVGAVCKASLSQTRRLQLAAESRGVAALMLRPSAVGDAPSAALTRWRIGPVPGKAVPGEGFTTGLAPLRWRLELFRCRGGMPGTWDVEWRDETRDLALAAPLRDRPAAPARLRAAG